MPTESRLTIHMAASLDGFIAREGGGVEWMETADEYEHGQTLAPETIEAFLKTIDCYVMGSHTYELALSFEAKGFGWAYGDKPTYVLTSRALPKNRDNIVFYSGDLAILITEQLRSQYNSIWVVGGGAVAGACLRLGLADELRYSIMPVLIGEGKPFFDKLNADVALHLVDVTGYKSGTVELHYHIKKDNKP